MKIAIVGGAGQLGAALARELSDDNIDVLALTRPALDVTAGDAVDRLTALAPDVIVNCSAWNDVDGAETNAAGATAVNCTGVGALAEAARRVGARFVHYSTDFVFDGAAEAPYDEESAASPLNCYGRTKLAGEVAARDAVKFYVLRLSSVFGGRAGEGRGGRGTIDRILDDLGAGRDVRAFTDRTVSPSYTVDVARATRMLLRMQAPFGLYHCVNSGWTTWHGLAVHAAQLRRSTSRIVPVVAADVAARARRPQFCALSNAKLAAAGCVMPTWQHALARHVARRATWLPSGSSALARHSLGRKVALPG